MVITRGVSHAIVSERAFGDAFYKMVVLGHAAFSFVRDVESAWGNAGKRNTNERQ